METTQEYLTRVEFEQYKMAQETREKTLQLTLDGMLKELKTIGEVMDYVRTGSNVFSYVYNNTQKIGYFALLLFGIYVLIKYGVFSAARWLSNWLGF